MTWRAFLIGLACVAGLSLLDPYTSYVKGYGWLIVGSFPVGAVLFLVALTLGVNAVLRLVRRGRELARPELMLVWCMLIVAAVVPTEGLGRWWYSMLAGAPYMARRPDINWEDGGSLEHAPDSLVLSRQPRSEAARRYFEGSPGGRVPWGHWLRPLADWAVLVLLVFAAVFLLCAMLRRQWVEVERLMFPLARVPLDFTEGAGRHGWLPDIFRNPSFRAGVIFALAFRLFRASPLFFGADYGIPLVFPIADALKGTALETVGFANVNPQLPIIGFAFLVPADVSLSVWFFFLFSRLELLIGTQLALPEAGGGTWSPMMRWQQFGAYLAFLVGMLYMARRHLFGVFRRALGLPGGADDSDEPVTYRFAFWGFLACVAGCLWWYASHGMNVLLGLFILALTFCSYMVYARIVCQGGVPTTRNLWSLTTGVEAFTGSGVFGAQGAAIASMQSTLLITGSTTVIGPMAMLALRISDVFERRKRWLMPALFCGILLAMACTTWVVLRQAYAGGALNFSDSWAVNNMATGAFNEAQRVMEARTTEWHRVHWRPFLFGTLGMGFLMFMRARFYWWPIHAIGLLTASSWNMANRLWLAFFIGWLIKFGIVKLAGGAMLRKARNFFIGLVIVESFLTGLSALVSSLSGGTVPAF